MTIAMPETTSDSLPMTVLCRGRLADATRALAALAASVCNAPHVSAGVVVDFDSAEVSLSGLGIVITDDFLGTSTGVPPNWMAIAGVNDVGATFDDSGATVVSIGDPNDGGGPAVMAHDTSIDPGTGFTLSVSIDGQFSGGAAVFGLAETDSSPVGVPRIIVNIDATRVSISGATSTGADAMYTLTSSPDFNSPFVLTVGDFGGGVFTFTNGANNVGATGFATAFPTSGLTLSALGNSTEFVIGSSASAVPEPSSLVCLSLIGFVLGCAKYAVTPTVARIWSAVAAPG